MAQFGELLAELRQDRKLTQKQLAQVIFVTPGTISNYENNAHFPDVEKLVELADFFGVTTDYLLGRSVVNLSLDILNEPVETGKTIGEFIKDFKGISPERRRILLQIMKDMKIGTMIDAYDNKKEFK